MSDLRDVTVDEMLLWREDIGVLARSLLGNRGCVNQKTYDEIKSRCDRVEQMKHWTDSFRHITELEISVHESVPYGVIRPRRLMKKIV